MPYYEVVRQEHKRVNRLYPLARGCFAAFAPNENIPLLVEEKRQVAWKCTPLVVFIDREEYLVSLDMGQFLAEDGSIDEGKLMRFFRKDVLHWKNAKLLADLYNETLGSEDTISARWIQRVEKENKIPINQQRRWVLATLLTIPPAMFGLKAFGSPAPGEQEFVPLTKVGPVDLEEYDALLKQLWASRLTNVGYYATGPGSLRQKIGSRIYALEQASLYGEKGQRERATELLCNYLIVFGNIHRDQGYPTDAITCLNKAIALAEEKRYYELWAKAFYLRGYAYFDRWGVSEDREDHTDLLRAMDDFAAAQEQVRRGGKFAGIGQSLQGAIAAEFGLAQAYNARDRNEKLAALKAVDVAGRIIQGAPRDRYFFQVNEEWYHIDKAEAFVALNWPNSAIDELENIHRGDPRKRRRYVYIDILETEAYAAKGWVEVAVDRAENALSILDEMRSATFLTRIGHTYRDLRQDSRYRRNTDVARLGVKLLKVRQPELFV